MKRSPWRWLITAPPLAGIATCALLLTGIGQAAAAVAYPVVRGANSTVTREMATSAAQQEQGALAAHAWRVAEAAHDRAQEARQDARQEARADAAAEAQLDAAQAAAAEHAQDVSQRHTAAHVPAVPSSQPYQTGAGDLSFGQLESLWVSAGGPSYAASAAASVAECESGGNPNAYNPSGASGLFQILGQVVPGNIFDPMVNALNAVAKFTASGDTWAQWVCQPA